MPATIKVKKVKPTSSRQYRTRSACKKPSKTNEKIEDDEDAKKIEDLKLAASLVNWSSYDKLMGKIFYDKVGKILEKKVDDFQKVKAELKTFVRENYDNQKALQTPRRAKPATALLEQISKFKQLNFDSDDEDMDDTTLLDQPEDLKENEEEQVEKEPRLKENEEVQMEKEPPTDLTVEGHISEEQYPVNEEEMEQEPSQEQMEEAPPMNTSAGVLEEAPPINTSSAGVLEEAPPNDPESFVEQEKEILYVPETPFASRVPINISSAGVLTTPITPYSPKPKKLKMLGTPHGIVSNSKPAVSSISKLAITKEIVKPTQPIQMPPIIRLTQNTFATPKKTQPFIPTKTPAKTPAALNTTFQKVQKLKQIDEKADQAKRTREDLLRERADRAKREREEREKRVEQNNRKKEEARLERENTLRRHLEAVKEFQNKEKQAAFQNYASPTVQGRMFQPLSAQSKKTHKTPNVKSIPATEVKSKEAQREHNTAIKKFIKTPIPQFTLEDECTLQTKNTPTSSSVVAVKTVAVKEFYLDEKENTKIIENEFMSEEHLEDERDDMTGIDLEQISMYDMTKEKEFLPSTENDYNVDDLSSGDETDNDEQPRKIVPKWALKENILARTQQIHRLLTKDQIERHFGRINQPTAQELFKGYKKNYPPRRASSSQWSSPMSDPPPGVGLYQCQFATPSTSKVNCKKR
uniref:INCENP_ARK-bind domain-containing protein n=1 Tax=Meloidogyne floridensis TaxID=298350 RepID=A0A915P564_9BILA